MNASHWVVGLAVALAGCRTFSEELLAIDAPPPDCLTNRECTERLTAEAGADTPAVCTKEASPKCVALKTPHCTEITGDYYDDNAVLIGGLFPTTGNRAGGAIPRKQAAILAVEQINQSSASGGILMSKTPGDTKKLVMLNCDEGGGCNAQDVCNEMAPAKHLVEELRVAAIIGPNSSQNTLDLTSGANELPSSANAGVAVLSPTAQASSIATIPDNNLTFMMVPSDGQRAPLMRSQINAVEAQMRLPVGMGIGRGRGTAPIKLAIAYRSDAVGQGTVASLTSLTINGTSLATAITLQQAREDVFDPRITNQTAIVDSIVALQADIVILLGAGEAIDNIMNPLETKWAAQLPTAPKPFYFVIDPAKVQNLLNFARGNNPTKAELRSRIRGTGVLPPPESVPVLNAFKIAYGQRWKDMNGNPQPSTGNGLGPAYDAVYTIALALVGNSDVKGPSISGGLPRLSNHPVACTSDPSGLIAPCFSIADFSRTLYTNMGMLLDRLPTMQIGTFGRLGWDANGAKNVGLVEMWCVTGVASSGTAAFSSSGLTYDIRTQTEAGTYTQCPEL